MSLRFSKASSIVRASALCGMHIVLKPDPVFVASHGESQAHEVPVLVFGAATTGRHATICVANGAFARRCQNVQALPPVV
jgi:hypothetical protein